jgi:Skp family chaperone for outer membrane proteins
MRQVHWIALLATAALAAGLIGANGLKPGPTKVGVCDIRRVVTEYARFVTLRQGLEAMQAEAKAEMERRDAEVKTIMKQLEDLKKGSEDYKRLQEVVWQKSVEARAYGEIQKGRMELKQQEGLRACYDDITQAIEAYCKDTGVDIVFTNRDVPMGDEMNTKDLEAAIATRYILYANTAIDVTDAVLAKLNAKQ